LLDSAQFPIRELKKRGMCATPAFFDIFEILDSTMQLPQHHFSDLNAFVFGDFNGVTRVVMVFENAETTETLCNAHQMYSSCLGSDAVRKLSALGVGHPDTQKLKNTRGSVNLGPAYVANRKRVLEMVRKRKNAEKETVRTCCVGYSMDDSGSFADVL
jgi:hypothetical protein